MGELDRFIRPASEAARLERERVQAADEQTEAHLEALQPLIEDFLDRMDAVGNTGLVLSREQYWLLSYPAGWAVTTRGHLLKSDHSDQPDQFGRYDTWLTRAAPSDVAAVHSQELGVALAEIAVRHGAAEVVPGPGLRRQQWKDHARDNFLELIPLASYFGASVAPAMVLVPHPSGGRQPRPGPSLRYWHVGHIEVSNSGQRGGYDQKSIYFCEDSTLRTLTSVHQKGFFRESSVSCLALPSPGPTLSDDALGEALIEILQEAGLDLGLKPTQAA